MKLIVAIKDNDFGKLYGIDFIENLCELTPSDLDKQFGEMKEEIMKDSEKFSIVTQGWIAYGIDSFRKALLKKLEGLNG